MHIHPAWLALGALALVLGLSAGYWLLRQKRRELEQRLAERAVLFDLLRVSASEDDLEAVLRGLTGRLAKALELREVALLLREGPGFVVRSADGFSDPHAVVGRTLAHGEGIAGVVAMQQQAIVIDDVSREPGYLSFWGEAAREGGFAAFPIHDRGQLIGLLAMTRPPERPFVDVESRLLHAICDQLALAIRHAKLIEDLRRRSTHDELTGLANRRLLRKRLGRELVRAKRFHVPVSVLAIDIDHFKRLNDRCGHPTGDGALKEVAAALRGRVRKVDTVARVGGEEFVVLLPHTTAAEGERLAEAIRHAVRGRSMPGGAGQPGGCVTVSIGVAEREKGEDADALLARADQALYAAKEGGRDRVTVHRRHLRAVS